MLSTTIYKQKIQSGALNDIFTRLYGSPEKAVPRYIECIEGFERHFGEGREVMILSAPGRSEIGGNHTDHNNGKVLAAAVNLDMIAVAAKSDRPVCRVITKGFAPDEVDLTQLEPIEAEHNTSASLIRGVAAGIKNYGGNIGGFDAYTMSDVLKGSGLSSSAAFEVLMGTTFNHLYNEGKIPQTEEAKIGRFAENRYFGKPSGLMDQMASAVGSFIAIDFKDSANPVIEKINFDFASSGYKLCIVDTGGSHAELTGEYASIRAEMTGVAALFGCKLLREVDEEEFNRSIPAVRAALGDRAVLRASHFFADCHRVEKQTEALNQGRFEDFLALVSQSGRSSFMYLQNAYVGTLPLYQGVPLALMLTEKILNGRGGFRLHGGGFGGTIQAYVPQNLLEEYKTEIEKVFGTGSCYVLQVRPVGSLCLDRELKIIG